MKDSGRYLNRELSWLSFNARVLEEAAREELPLLERAKFLAIVSSNLDEFFMVRVGKLERKADAGENTPDPAGMMPRQQLRAIRKASGQQVKRQYELFHGRYNGIQALIQQIDTMKAGSGVDKEDQKLLNTEVRGLVAMCLKEVAAYNAESNQLTTGWLLGTSLPKQLDAAICRKEQA